ncbi:hypothetical protein ACOSQ3_012518 [Xanthoceras sorbifolium]
MANGSSSTTSAPDQGMSSSSRKIEFASISKALNFNLSVKLTRDNFVHWRAQVLPAIRALELDEYINGEKSCPSKFVELIFDNSGEKEIVVNDKYVDWRRSDQLLLCWLMSTVSEGLIGEVTDCNTSLEFWQVLEFLFSSESLAKVMQLKQELQNAKNGSSTISEFVLKVKSYGNSLKSARQVVTDKDLLLSVLNGLGHDYDPVVALLSQQQSSITLYEAKYMLMTHKQRIDHLNLVSQIEILTPSINFVSNNGGRATFNRGGPNSNQSGGRGNNNRGKKGRGRWNNNRLTCQICHRSGHSAVQCYNRYD